MHKKSCALIIMFIIAFSFAHFVNYATAQEEKPLVVTTTTVLASIVRDLAGDLVDVKYLVSPSMCPGHYDIKPGDVETIRSASLILAHGMEWSSWLGELINAANQTGDLFVPIYNVPGPWNSPPTLKQKYSTVADILENTFGFDLDAQLSRCLSAIDSVSEELLQIAKENSFNNTPAVVMLWQLGFIKYLGFKVVATYGPPEFLSAEDIMEIEENATKYGAKLVIDNLHSGVDVGARIANDVGAVHVVLINFPEAIPGISNITEMMLYNARLLADSLRQYDVLQRVSSLKHQVELWRYVSIGLLLLLVVESLALVVMVKRRE